MWIKINNPKEKAEFVDCRKIIDYNRIANITNRDINTAKGTLTLTTENGDKLYCKPHKGDYDEWLDMLHYSRIAITGQP